jgi:hypothetical protein
MARNFEKINIDEFSEVKQYDAWQLTIDKEMAGWYFVPKGVSGIDYDNALKSAEQKLINLGLTELEAKAIIGKQLF